MVLQREKPVRIWGWGTPGESVNVRFAGQAVTGQVAADESWSVELSPLETSFEERSIVVEHAGQSLEVLHVLVGEVWVCGGQSNMEWTLRSSRDADLELTGADHGQIRYLRV
ncbi:MAG: sialate O-acetylesterase, partial [Planctomycetota bacterium]